MKIKIVNKSKFIRSIIIVLGVVILGLLLLGNTYSKTEITYKEDYIISGDTLWSIAQNQVNNNEYYKNKDIREVMYEIKQLNNIGNGNLEVGQKIKIPSI